MKYFLITLFVLIITLVISQVVITKNTSDTGSIPYETLEVFDEFEIRQYPQLVVASTQLDENSYDENSSIGFRRIASYIFGGNSNNSQISMTSPVQMEMGRNSKMSFFMPPNMKLEDLPQPNSTQVVLNLQPSKTYAVISFSGWASDEILKEKYEELKSL
ncbi:MAG: heme-binding protein [Crocinitomicaceae bacterium]